jgi:hypothetical protein
MKYLQRCYREFEVNLLLLLSLNSSYHGVINKLSSSLSPSGLEIIVRWLKGLLLEGERKWAKRESERRERASEERERDREEERKETEPVATTSFPRISHSPARSGGGNVCVCLCVCVATWKGWIMRGGGTFSKTTHTHQWRMPASQDFPATYIWLRSYMISPRVNDEGHRGMVSDMTTVS